MLTFTEPNYGTTKLLTHYDYSYTAFSNTIYSLQIVAMRMGECDALQEGLYHSLVLEFIQ